MRRDWLETRESLQQAASPANQAATGISPPRETSFPPPLPLRSPLSSLSFKLSDLLKQSHSLHHPAYSQQFNIQISSSCLFLPSFSRWRSVWHCLSSSSFSLSFHLSLSWVTDQIANTNSFPSPLSFFLLHLPSPPPLILESSLINSWEMKCHDSFYRHWHDALMSCPDTWQGVRHICVHLNM